MYSPYTYFRQITHHIVTEPAAVERESVGGGQSAGVSVPGPGDAGRSPQAGVTGVRGRICTVEKGDKYQISMLLAYHTVVETAVTYITY